jgi:hypothetical protein
MLSVWLIAKESNALSGYPPDGYRRVSLSCARSLSLPGAGSVRRRLTAREPRPPRA